MMSRPSPASLLVDDRFGVVRSLDRIPTGPGDIALHQIRARVGATHPVLGQHIDHSGLGADRDPQRARQRALGEAIERYCPATWRPASLPLSTAAALQAHAEVLTPADLQRFLPGQYAQPGFPFPPWSPAQALRWIQAISLESGADIWVPAQHVLIPYTGAAWGEPLLDDLSSNGLACGPTCLAAVCSAVLEVVERHALCWWWYTGHPATRIPTEGICPPPLLEVLREARIAVTLLMLPGIPEVPTVAAVLRTDRAREPSVVVGLGAGLSLSAAVDHAVTEGAMVFNAARRLPPPSGRPPQTPAERGLGYAWRPELQAHLDAVVAAAHPEPADPLLPPLTPEGLLAAVQRAGMRPLAIDLTSSDVAAAGLHVVRVLIPEAIPHEAHPQRPHLGAPRLCGVTRPNPLPVPIF